jgi:hypothetical protein
MLTKHWKTYTLIALVVVLSAGAVEASLRTNPLSHPPRVTRALGAEQLEKLEPSIVASMSAPCSVVSAQSDMLVACGKDLGLVTLVRADDGDEYVQRGRVALPGPPLAVEVQDDVVAVACAWAGTAFIDISRPELPVTLGTVPSGSSARSVVMRGPYAYVADWDSGLQVISLEIPAQPQVVTYANTPGHSYDVAVKGTRAFVADFEGGVRVFDISDPLKPKASGAWQTMTAATGISTKEQLVFVADEQRGLFTVDITNAAAPQILSDIRTEVAAHDVEMSGRTALVSDLAGGVSLVDLSDPRAPRDLGRTQIGGSVVGVSPLRDVVYLASGKLLVAEVPR